MRVQKLLQGGFLGLLVDSLAVSSSGVEPPPAAVHALAAIGGFVTAVPPQLQPDGLAAVAAEGAAAMVQLAADTYAEQVEAAEAAAAEKAKEGKKEKDDKKDRKLQAQPRRPRPSAFVTRCSSSALLRILTAGDSGSAKADGWLCSVLVKDTSLYCSRPDRTIVTHSFDCCRTALTGGGILADLVTAKSTAVGGTTDTETAGIIIKVARVLHTDKHRWQKNARIYDTWLIFK